METFAFLVSSATAKDIAPFGISQIKKLHSAQGKEIQGYFISCPVSESRMEENIISASRIAENLRVSILGLDRDIALVTERLNLLSKKLEIPLTTGDTYTAWSVFEAAYRLLKVKKLNLSHSSVAVLGATSPVGNLCARKLAERAAKLILQDSQKNKLEALKKQILDFNSLEVIITDDARGASGADLEISVSFNITLRLKKEGNGTVECALVKLPDGRIVHAALGETMLLALEEKFMRYSQGDNLNLENLEEIADIATRHGFEVWVPEAPLL